MDRGRGGGERGSVRHPSLATDLADLVLARACHVCHRPGRVLCGPCLSRLRGAVRDVDLPGLPPLMAALPYEGAGSHLVLEYKERGNRALAPMLGVLLADAVRAHLDPRGRRRVLLVPVPAHRRAARGFDALGGIVSRASRELDRLGTAAAVARPVRAASAYRPLKGLARDDRRRSVADAFAADGAEARRTLVARCPVIVVDDVATTGATIGEVVRVLSAAGVRVDASAVIAVASRDTWASSPGPVRSRSRP